uniref:ParB/RepB/Spo0J family partition protein n=1 Tax=Streptomyces sp. SAT1 TaxID=1849967 RepID=UPI0007F990CD|nr:ParB/RepB/Spo0J family partition protein [Streptomyces sp. SAT1]ANO42830.1 plasmid partitioning protein [Streptomyces sp. SAT1]
MSKREQLGRGSSFGSTSTRSARRNAINETINRGAGTADLTDLPVPAISDNPDNPRNHLRNLEYTVESVREVGVILPIVVGTVDAYVRSRPDRADDLNAGAQYVVIDGHRRLEAARQVGLATIPVRVDDARLSTDEKLLESAFIANYHREDMTDLEEAQALKQLVDYYGGSQTKACKRLSMSPSTLSSKLSLLKLSPELQKDLMTGVRKTEHVRNLSKLSPEAQKAKADERAEASNRRARSRQQPAPEPADFHGVKSHSEVTPGAAGQPSLAANGGGGTPETIPEPRGTGDREDQQDYSAMKKFPYHDGLAAGNLILFKMPAEERDKVLDLLLRDREKRVANAG